MNRRFLLSALTMVLFGYGALASATESARHNDMDGDGRSDLIWRNASTGAIVFWSAADSGSRLKVPYTSDLRTWAPVLALSDFWDDPSRNVLMLRDSRGEAAILNPYSGTVDEFSDLLPYPVAHGDFDGNGLADLLSRVPRSGRNYIEFNAMVGNFLAEGMTTYQEVPMVPLDWSIAGIGDFDGDGRSDILWRNAITGRNAIWRSGNRATQLTVASVANLDWSVAAVGDYDGDGRSDILWRNMRSGVNVIWRSGNNLLPQAVATVSKMDWKVAATGDFNGDGQWDLVWRNTVTGGNVLWRSAMVSTRQALPAVTLSWQLVM